MNEFELMEESIRDDFQGAVDHLDTISDDDFRKAYADVLSLHDRFKNGDHVLLLDVLPDGESGMEDYRFQLLDVSIEDAESIADPQVEVSHFENRDDAFPSPLGTRSVTFIGDEAVVHELLRRAEPALAFDEVEMLFELVAGRVGGVGHIIHRLVNKNKHMSLTCGPDA